MELLLLRETTLSPADQALVDRARRAVAPINRTFSMVIGDETFPQIAAAIVWPSPLRLDFQAYWPGTVGQAFLGPQVPLTEELFAGEGFTKDFRDTIEAAMDYFDEYLRKPE